MDDYFRFVPYATKLFTSSLAYSQQCYNDNIKAQECSIYIKKSLSKTIEKGTGCPFHDTLCRPNSTVLRLDSGKIDSEHDLGINTASGDRFSFRTLVDCSPLTVEGYSSKNVSSGYVDYLYGGIGYGAPPNSKSSSPGLMTYSYPDNTNTTYEDSGHNSYYVIDDYVYEPSESENSDWIPITELQRHDASTFIFFLSANYIMYVEPAEDDWFSAHRPSDPYYRSDYNGSFRGYYSDFPANPLGCTQQWQFCNPASGACTPLDTFGEATTSASTNLFHSGNQNDTFNFWLKEMISLYPSLDSVIGLLKTSSLEASSRLAGSLSGPLQASQWQQEISSWMDVALALIQKASIEAATGPFDISVKEYVSGPTDNNICKLQRKRGRYQSLEWISNETLQIQRMAHEAIGSGTWFQATSSIPITGRDEELADLDISDEHHPFLAKVPSQTNSQEERLGSGEKPVPFVHDASPTEDQNSQCNQQSNFPPAQGDSEPHPSTDPLPAEETILDGTSHTPPAREASSPLQTPPEHLQQALPSPSPTDFFPSTTPGSNQPDAFSRSRP
ncbi:MAG: hypothetical protein Q9160_008788 [Pyrenula sp. 1 TL-2023]